MTHAFDRIVVDIDMRDLQRQILQRIAVNGVAVVLR